MRLLLTSAAIPFPALAHAAYSLTSLHTNDFHDRQEPINSFDSTCDAETNAKGECFGGSARLVTALAAARARSDNTILVDAGDRLQGSLFYTQYKGSMMAEFMTRFGYDAMTVGNHEFDDGPAVLRGFMNAVQFPVLMSNADVSAEPLLADKLMKSVVIERGGGEKLGLIGLTPQDTSELVSPGPNVTFDDPVAAVQAKVDRLTAEGVTKIIVLGHSGYRVDQRVAAETTGVDVIVGGHTNTYLSNSAEAAERPYPTMVGKSGVGQTAIVSAYVYGKFLGELNVVFDDAGVVVSATGESLIMDAAVAEDADTLARIAELAVPLAEIRSRVVADTVTAIDGRRDNCRAVECRMGNLVAEAMLARVADQGVTIALANGGGLRASIDAGPVTMGEVLTVLLFQNTLATFEVDGAGIVAALENGVSQVEDGAGRFLQVAGLTYAFDPALPAGARVSDVMVLVGGDARAPIDPAGVYLAVTNNYVRKGGDGSASFRTAAKAHDFGSDLADVVAEYMAGAGPCTPFTDGRITRK